LERQAYDKQLNEMDVSIAMNDLFLVAPQGTELTQAVVLKLKSNEKGEKLDYFKSLSFDKRMTWKHFKEIVINALSQEPFYDKEAITHDNFTITEIFKSSKTQKDVDKTIVDDSEFPVRKQTVKSVSFEVPLRSNSQPSKITDEMKAGWNNVTPLDSRFSVRLDETVDLSNLSFKVSETLQKYKSPGLWLCEN
jgi:hypothetical protein